MSLDHNLCLELAKHVETLTTSGQPSLDQAVMKELKKICKKSDEYVKHVFHLVMTQIEKEHAEIRLSAFLITNELFNRSHCFRELLLADFQNFLECTTETDANNPLPPPAATAKMLKMKALEAVQQWNEKFGDAYKKLYLGYNFLKNCKKVDFQDIRARSVAERRRSEEIQQRHQLLQKQKLEKTIEEMNETSQEIKTVLTQLENCMKLILPNPEEFSLHDLQSPTNSPSNPWTKYEETPKHSKSRKRKNSRNSRNGDVKDEIGDTAAKPHSKGKSPIGNKCSTPVKKTLKMEKRKNSSSEGKQTDVVVKTEPGTDQNEHCKIVQGLNDLSSDEDFEEISDGPDEHSSEYDSDGYQPANVLQHHGLGSKKYSITINAPSPYIEIVESEDNTDILHTMKDLLRLLDNKFLVAVNRWLEVFSKVGASQDQIKRAIDIKQKLQSVKDRVLKIKVTEMKKSERKGVDRLDSVDDGEDDDFETVPEKEGFEPRVPDHLRKEYGLEDKQPKAATSTQWSLSETLEAQNNTDPTTWQANLKALKDKVKSDNSPISQPSTSKGSPPMSPDSSRRRAALLQRAPHIPFSTDLMNWGEKLEAPMLVRFDSEHRFWTPKENDQVEDKNAVAALTSRLIDFTGEFKPVEKTCRAPLSNGKLCPRMDRVKCPFHGKIIPRDSMGNPTNPEDIAATVKKTEAQTEASGRHWEDVELQADIEAATGIQLTRKGKGHGGKGRGRQKKYPHLTDLKKKTNTTRTRLEKKVLSQRALKRVAGAMDSIDARRFNDKFANQFVYAIKPK